MSATDTPKDGLDAHGEWVWHFRMEAHNLSKVSLLRQLVLEAFEAGHWRSYATGTGRDTWRACEFDYFLIASDIAYADAANVFTWKDRGRALAEATVSDDPKKRRTLEQASAAWQSPTPQTLEQRAARLGWTSTTSATGVHPAAPERARAYVRHKMTWEEHAQEQRQRQLKDRRARLNKIIESVIKRTRNETERRYIIDELRKRVRRNPQQWARDVERLKRNAKALATHWQLSQNATYMRIRQITKLGEVGNNRKAS